MWPWQRSQKPAKMLEPEPEPVVDREAELRSELQQIGAKLAELNRAALQLRARYTLKINRFGEIVGSQADLAEYPRVQIAWRTILKQRDPLLFRRNKILAQWSALKQESHATA
jgi:hypothetical protein